MRVADMTADRAALLAVGSFDAAKRAVFLLHLRSRRELDEMDIDSWMRQAESQDQTMVRYSQMVTSATPYLGSRLVELKKFSETPQYAALRRKVEAESGASLEGLFDERGYLKKFRPPKKAPPAKPSPPAGRVPAAPGQKAKMLEGSCPACRAPFAIRLLELPDKDWLDIPCKSCGGTFRLRLDGIR
jgi:hypothetical protein